MSPRNWPFITWALFIPGVIIAQDETKLVYNSLLPRQSPNQTNQERRPLQASAQIVTDASLYAGTLTYGGDTPRQNGTLTGASVGLLILDQYRFDLDLNRIDIALESANDLSQVDGTMAFTYFEPHIALRMFAHGAYGSDVHVRTLGAGLLVYSSQEWQLSLAPAWSSISLGPNSFHTAQIQPHFGLTWYHNDQWHLGQDLSGLIIAAPTVTAQGNDLFLSGESHLYVSYDAIGLAVGGWIGERRYAVLDHGFTVFDIPATYQQGYVVELSWRHAATYVSLKWQRQHWHYDGASDEAYNDLYLAFISITF